MRSYPVIDMGKTGRNLQTECESRGITAKELQQYLGLTGRQSIYSWFQGKALPTVDHFFALSRYLGISMDELVIQREEEESRFPEGINFRELERRHMAYFGFLMKAEGKDHHCV